MAYLNTLDSDKIETHTYALVDYTNYPNNFNFELIKIELRTRVQFDFEKRNKYLIKIRTTDFRGLFLRSNSKFQ